MLCSHAICEREHGRHCAALGGAGVGLPADLHSCSAHALHCGRAEHPVSPFMQLFPSPDGYLCRRAWVLAFFVLRSGGCRLFCLLRALYVSPAALTYDS